MIQPLYCAANPRPNEREKRRQGYISLFPHEAKRSLSSIGDLYTLRSFAVQNFSQLNRIESVREKASQEITINSIQLQIFITFRNILEPLPLRTASNSLTYPMERPYTLFNLTSSLDVIEELPFPAIIPPPSLTTTTPNDCESSTLQQELDQRLINLVKTTNISYL